MESKKFSVSEEWMSICQSIAKERGVHEVKIRLLRNLEILREQIIPDYLETEVAEFKGNAKASGNPSKYLADCIVDWLIAAVHNPDMNY